MAYKLIWCFRGKITLFGNFKPCSILDRFIKHNKNYNFLDQINFVNFTIIIIINQFATFFFLLNHS